MKTYTEQELIELVGSREDVNFLAGAITPWHAIGIDATILRLTEQGIILKGYIMLVAHNITGSAISEKNFHMATTHAVPGIEVIQVVPDTFPKSVTEKVRIKYQLYGYYMRSVNGIKKKDFLYWAVPFQPSFDLIPRVNEVLSHKQIQIILTDEGSGSYTMTVWKWWRYHYMEGGIKATRNILLRNPFFLHRLAKRGQIQHYQLLTGRTGHFEINKSVGEYYRKIFAMEDFQEDYSVYEGAVLINTNMLQQIGALADDSESRIYMEICKRLVKLGIKVVIKPHPREKDMEKYQNIPGCFLEKRKGTAQETILATLGRKPYCVIGFSSTTLVTSKALFGIETISADLLLDRNQMKNKQSFDTFDTVFANLIHMPKTMDELVACVKQIKEEYDRKSE